MIIKINKNQEIISTSSGLIITADNIISFEVDCVPQHKDGKIICFNPETREFYYKDRPAIEPEVIKARQELAQKHRKAEEQKAYCLKWLADNDWKINKRMLGEWVEGDERWVQYLAERKLIREQYDAAEAVLNTKN